MMNDGIEGGSLWYGTVPVYGMVVLVVWYHTIPAGTAGTGTLLDKYSSPS
jgi:hypothetical protein